MTTPILVALATMILVVVAEFVHARRVALVQPLMPQVPRALFVVAPLVRVLTFTALAWALTTLFLLPPKAHRSKMKTIEPKEREHLLLVLDVSPSMRLQDAGEVGKDSRSRRASSLVSSLLERVSDEKMHFTVIATYSGAKPVVKESRDREVLLNILNDLNMQYAFEVGKTRLFAGLEEAAKIAKDWRPDSATLVLISDGDTVPPSGMPRMPPSVGGALVVGVGDPMKGTLIDGRQSRQDVSTLREIANRLGGEYHDGNLKHVPTATLRSLGSLKVSAEKQQLTLREYALFAIALASFLLASLPLILYLLTDRKKLSP
ncbi:vWA domain-containing protein [Roseibacillus persicicus]|uniref:vWA domain-containing protein n=1 Tax=Roseibacillus persicicus TaxID=454148 RepID=UPI00280C769F|nr:vWA domain-containing protein [Roseibacillus persicicus]MDQ8189939.1 VWA domain-containing protein [Roseibacillus persicicus]